MFLILNIGSSSFKYAVFDDKLKELERDDFSAPYDALEILGTLMSRYSDILTIGHRIVHGGVKYFKPTKVDKKIIQDLKALSPLAPLHNPPALKVLKECIHTYSDIPQWAVFDTGFYREIPLFSKIYAIPFEYFEKHGIQRFGFHGTSHKYVAYEAAKKLKKPLESLKLITCHLGAGCSITAIEDGKPIDTSMGFTPLEGLMMATRSGDLDPGILFYLKRELGLSSEKIEKTLNEKSGLLGVSGVSSGLLEVIQAAQEAETKCKKDQKVCATEKSMRAGLAIQMYAYRVKKYVGAYFVALGGLDALVFTGKVGERNELIRDMITNGLEVLGKLKVLVIPTDEELQIAKEIKEAVEKE